MSDEVLDNLPWHALTGPQAQFAQGDGRALRFPRTISPFCATERLDADGWRALVDLVGPGRAMVLFQAGIDRLPENVTEIVRIPTLQMVADGVAPTTLEPADDIAIEPLGDDDADAMVALTALTEPGPFFAETHRLGTYLGVRENGRLIAMAGERLRADGVAEISAVCTHPDARRRGLAAALTKAMVDEIRGRDALPLLHVATANTGAIAVYEQLGFRIRSEIHGLAARVDAAG
ncbi:MAG: GNAT family N-acetyltransferase [Actinomycetota bacterium]